MPRYRKRTDLARNVASIKKKPPAPSLRTRTDPRRSSRDALKLLVVAHVERVRAGSERLEVQRFQIAKAGRQTRADGASMRASR